MPDFKKTSGKKKRPSDPGLKWNILKQINFTVILRSDFNLNTMEMKLLFFSSFHLHITTACLY